MADERPEQQPDEGRPVDEPTVASGSSDSHAAAEPGGPDDGSGSPVPAVGPAPDRPRRRFGRAGLVVAGVVAALVLAGGGFAAGIAVGSAGHDRPGIGGHRHGDGDRHGRGEGRGERRGEGRRGHDGPQPVRPAPVQPGQPAPAQPGQPTAPVQPVPPTAPVQPGTVGPGVPGGPAVTGA